MLSFRDALNEELKNPDFKREWDASEPEYQATVAQIRADLAAKKTTPVLKKYDASDDIRWSITDPLGAKIVLKTSTFHEHILSDHADEDSKIRQKLESCAIATLINPSLIAEDNEDNSRHIYYGVVALQYKEPELRVKMFRVVVDTDRTPNQVVTWTVVRRGDKIEDGVMLYGQRIYLSS